MDRFLMFVLQRRTGFIVVRLNRYYSKGVSWNDGILRSLQQQNKFRNTERSGY